MPLVTVICLCYNHAKFVQQAVESVLRQTYSAIQLIVVDDASTDNSCEVIQALVAQHPTIEFLPLEKNLGNCKAFNRGLTLAKGAFIIDLAADDILLPDRIETGVRELTQKGSKYGVHFSDVDIIDEAGAHLYFHSEKFPHHTIPQGDVYQAIIGRYFICPPTVMATREVMDALNGYDESLSYEDFDFWVRSSRTFFYTYSPEVLVKRRVSANALSGKQFQFFNKHSRTTLRVCEKIMELNSNKAEQRTLAQRIAYEIKLNVRLLNWATAMRFFFLWLRNRQRVF